MAHCEKHIPHAGNHEQDKSSGREHPCDITGLNLVVRQRLQMQINESGYTS